MKITVRSLLESGPPPSADEVAAIVVAISMQQVVVTTAASAAPSRFRLDGRNYEPYDRELP